MAVEVPRSRTPTAPAIREPQARSLVPTAKDTLVRDFVAPWDKVMNLDRFDLPGRRRTT